MKRKSPPCGIFCCTSDLAQRARSIVFQQLKARAFPCLYYPQLHLRGSGKRLMLCLKASSPPLQALPDQAMHCEHLALLVSVHQALLVSPQYLDFAYSGSERPSRGIKRRVKGFSTALTFEVTGLRGFSRRPSRLMGWAAKCRPTPPWGVAQASP